MVIQAVLFLASEQSSIITGVALPVDDGMLKKQTVWLVYQMHRILILLKVHSIHLKISDKIEALTSCPLYFKQGNHDNNFVRQSILRL